tara:strand:- start:736 stop:957 length:222 start_codon:yes stop_codon:yes gene_type:complete
MRTFAKIGTVYDVRRGEVRRMFPCKIGFSVPIPQFVYLFSTANPPSGQVSLLKKVTAFTVSQACAPDDVAGGN